MSSYSLDVETFISEVKKYPEIWNLQSEDYRFKSKKQQAWSEIARVFIADFDDMPALEKMAVFCVCAFDDCVLQRSHRKLYGKWRNIRDSYVRHVKRNYGKRGYVYANHLTFLNNIYKQNSQSGSDVDCEIEDHSDEDDVKLTSLGFKNGKFDLLNNASVWGSDVEDSPSTIENLKRKRCSKLDNNIEYVDTPFSDATSSYASPVEDEDRSFFESLLPAVREFNIDQKLEFRSEVLRLVQNIRSAGDKISYIKVDLSRDNFD